MSWWRQHPILVGYFVALFHVSIVLQIVVVFR